MLNMLYLLNIVEKKHDIKPHHRHNHSFKKIERVQKRRPRGVKNN